MTTPPVVCPDCGADLVVKETITSTYPVHARTGVFDADSTELQIVVSTFLVCSKEDYHKEDCDFYRILEPLASGKNTIDPALLVQLTYEETVEQDYADALNAMDTLLKETP